MEKQIFNSILDGIKEAVSYEKGELPNVKSKKITVEPVPRYEGKEIRKIREQLNLTQNSFALVMGVSIKTVEAWEAGINIPQGPAQRMLDILKNEENALKRYYLLAEVS